MDDGMGLEPALARALRERAHTCPDRTAYEFVGGDGQCEVLTYGELATRCQAVTTQLKNDQPAGRPAPALVCYPPGLDYVVAVLGCVGAGVPAIPAYPPQLWNRQAVLERLAHIRRDAGSVQILADPETIDALGGPRDIDAGAAARPDSQAAIIQYTSGSTAAPRGVVVTHANLAHNMAALAAAYGLDADSRGVCWLPPYHDMGLITGILLPLFAGYRVRLFSPVDFLKDPLSWLRQIGATSATFSGAPNFAYDLCVRRAAGTDLGGLDLSSWSVAFNGAEPVRRRTLEEFAAAFAPAGFRAGALAPSYGLAEATLLVSAGRWHPARTAGDDRVGCGRPLADQELVVADPATGQRTAEGREGEIWLRGPSVTPGYWAGAATVPHDSGRLDGRTYLRTGDLGYLRDGELVITGRAKDVIIRHGVNYHPEDVEAAALPGPAFRPVRTVFGAETGSGSVVCLALESVRGPAPGGAGSPAGEAEAVRGRVLRQVGLRLDTVLALPAGTIPRTSSGKMCRLECREIFQSGVWDQYVAVGVGASGQAVGRLGEGELERSLTGLVGAVFAAACAVPDCPPGMSIFDIGGDSVRAAEAAGVLGQALGLDVPVDVVMNQACPTAVSRQLISVLSGPARTSLALRIAALGGRHD